MPVKTRGGPLHFNNGYLITSDRDKGLCKVHRVCWETHNGPIPPGRHIHHRDGDRSNNRLSNLVCLTPRQHRIAHRKKLPEGWGYDEPSPIDPPMLKGPVTAAPKTTNWAKLGLTDEVVATLYSRGEAYAAHCIKSCFQDDAVQNGMCRVLAVVAKPPERLPTDPEELLKYLTRCLYNEIAALIPHNQNDKATRRLPNVLPVQ